MQYWLILKTKLRHELEVATAIDLEMQADWACVPALAAVKPIARRKFTIRWQPALPGCVLVPFERSGMWDTLRNATGYLRDVEGWPYAIPGSQIDTFTQCLSAVNSAALNATTKGQSQKGKKQTYQKATHEVLAQIARDLFGVDLSTMASSQQYCSK